MNAARANIGKHTCQVGSDLLLHIQVPLHHVVTLGMRFEVGGAQAVGRKRNILAPEVVKGMWTSTKVNRVPDHRIRKQWNGLRYQ